MHMVNRPIAHRVEIHLFCVKRCFESMNHLETELKEVASFCLQEFRDIFSMGFVHDNGMSEHARIRIKDHPEELIIINHCLVAKDGTGGKIMAGITQTLLSHCRDPLVQLFALLFPELWSVHAPSSQKAGSLSVCVRAPETPCSLDFLEIGKPRG